MGEMCPFQASGEYPLFFITFKNKVPQNALPADVLHSIPPFVYWKGLLDYERAGRNLLPSPRPARLLLPGILAL